MNQKFLSSGLVLIFSLFLTSCASTKLISPWRDSSFKGPFKKVFVVAVVKNRGTRVLIENEFMKQLRAQGAEASGSTTVVSEDALPTRESLEPRVRAMGADGLLVIRFVKKESVETYSPARDNGVPVTFDANTLSPFQFFETSEPATTYDFDRVVMKLTLYDVSAGKPVWSALSETKFQGEGFNQIKPFTAVVINKLVSEGLIQ